MGSPQTNTLTGTITLTNDATVGADAYSTLTLSGAIGDGSNGYWLTIANASGGTTILSATNTFAGSVAVDAGTLVLSGGAALADTVAVSLGSGSTMTLTNDETIGSLAGSGDVNLGTALLTTGGDDTSTTFSGAIGGTGSLTKTGTGTFTLSGTNTYIGATSVNAGTLVVNGSIATSSSVTVSTATLQGTGTLPALMIGSGGVVAPGNSPGTLTVTNGLAIGAGGTLSAEINGTTPGSEYDQFVVTGTVDLSGATLAATLGFTPAAGSSFILIDNDGNDPVVGTFAGLPEGATVNVNGVAMSITYTGGDGNDVALVVPVSASIDDVAANEGQAGNTPFIFTVTLSAPSSVTVAVDYTTVDGTATAGSDFATTSGTLTFAPGQTSQTITVLVRGDTTIEPVETFTVQLSNAIHASIVDGTGVGTIRNDDVPVVVSVGTSSGTPGAIRTIDPTSGQLVRSSRSSPVSGARSGWPAAT